jgi:hypothetical protein
MNKNLSFDTPQVEQSFKNGVFVRNFDIIKLTMILNLLISAWRILSQINDIYWVISLLRILVTFLILFISMAFMNLNKLETSHNIRWLMEIDIIINILIQANFINYDELGVGINSNSNLIRKNSNSSSLFSSSLSLSSLQSNLDVCKISHFYYLDIFPTCNINDSFGNSLSK